MITETLKTLFSRDLEKLKLEIASYNSEEKLWYTEGAITNSAGNLCLHLIGNLSHFIGAVMGKSGYVRDRPAEFASKDIPKAELIVKIEETILVVNNTLSNLVESELDTEYPIVVFDKPMTTAYFLVHLAMHLDYHLGQINYHRRLLDN
jgi:hypothetical protein